MLPEHIDQAVEDFTYAFHRLMKVRYWTREQCIEIVPSVLAHADKRSYL